MLIRRAPMFKASEITDYRLYLNRREFILGAAALALRRRWRRRKGHLLRAAKSGEEFSLSEGDPFKEATT
jgi:hypothetical protein